MITKTNCTAEEKTTIQAQFSKQSWYAQDLFLHLAGKYPLLAVNGIFFCICSNLPVPRSWKKIPLFCGGVMKYFKHFTVNHLTINAYT